jgi:type IV pilus assembly protein PilN
MDLEHVLPSGVQVTSIDPSITKEGDVNIRLRVSGDRDKAVQLVRNLEKSRRFLSPRLSNESLQASQQGATGAYNQLPAGAQTGVQFDILSGYNPVSTVEAAALSVEPKKHETANATAPKHRVAKKAAPRASGLSAKRKSSGGRR